jgi:hypothetical protein
MLATIRFRTFWDYKSLLLRPCPAELMTTFYCAPGSVAENSDHYTTEAVFYTFQSYYMSLVLYFSLEARDQFPARPKKSSGSGTGSTQPREYN